MKKLTRGKVQKELPESLELEWRDHRGCYQISWHSILYFSRHWKPKVCANPFSRCWGILIYKWPAGGARCLIRILLLKIINRCCFSLDQSSGPTDRPTDIAIYMQRGLITLICVSLTSSFWQRDQGLFYRLQAQKHNTFSVTLKWQQFFLLVLSTSLLFSSSV